MMTHHKFLQSGNAINIPEYRNMYNTIFYFRSTLDEADVALLKPHCQALNIPVQTLTNVFVAKKLLKEDQHTGQIIKYNSISIDKASCSSVVTLNSSPEFGHIKRFFRYIDTQFVVAVE